MIDAQCVINANSQFWEQMLAMELEPIPIPKEICDRTGYVLGIVQLSGIWTGRVEVRMTEGLAREATMAMLMQPGETVSEADTLDAAREITNMIAGSIKSSLPRPCLMALPEAVLECSGPRSFPMTEDSLTVAFHHSAGDLMVSVWGQETAC